MAKSACVQVGRQLTLLSVPCHSLPVHTHPSEPKDSALSCACPRSGPCPASGHGAGWSGAPGRGGQARKEGMGQLAGTLPARVGARTLPNSWEKEILLLLAGREGKQGLLWEMVLVGGWR